MLLNYVLEKILESPLDSKEIQQVHPQGNQSWIFIERTDTGAEAPTLWPSDVKNWLIWTYSDAGKIESGRIRGWQMMRWLDDITWVWVNSGSWWWTGKPGVLQSMGWQRVRCDWATELNWTWCLRGFPTDTSGKEPLPANAGDLIYGVWSLGQENPLEEEIATHFSILAWRIPWTEEPGRLQSKRSQRNMTEQSMDTHDRYCGNKTQ